MLNLNIDLYWEARGRPKGSVNKVKTDGVHLPGSSIAKRTTTFRKASALRKDAWKTWLTIYESETHALLERSRKATVRCPECQTNVAKDSFINHRLKQGQGCSAQDPKLKMSFWPVDNYL